MTDTHKENIFIAAVQSLLDQAAPAELYRLADACTGQLDLILREGFDRVNEGFNPDEGTKPIVMIREKLLPVFSEAVGGTYTAEDIDVQEAKIVFDFFKSANPVDIAIKSLQDKLRLLGNEESMTTYIALTNTLEKTVHGGLTSKDPMFVKAKNPADTLYVVFAGMVCFPEFKKSIEQFGNVDQLHVLDPNRSWYMQGPEGAWDGYEHYSTVLREQIASLNAANTYKKICFLGNSMGASAACLYSGFADAVLAFCPQTEIPRKEIQEDVKEIYKNLLRKNLEKSCADGKDIRIHRGVSANDITQCARLPEGITPIVHEGCDVHNLPGYLKSEGILQEVLGSVL